MILENARWKMYLVGEFYALYGNVDGRERWISTPISYEILENHVKITTSRYDIYIIEDVANNTLFMKRLDEVILNKSYST
jgi:hypothetical protein